MEKFIIWNNIYGYFLYFNNKKTNLIYLNSNLKQFILIKNK